MKSWVYSLVVVMFLGLTLGCSGGDSGDETSDSGISSDSGSCDVDSDDDGTPDCYERCPDDPEKLDPGICGCGVADSDSDDDGVLDCNDDCPDDAARTTAGACGCGAPDTDSDGDGEPDCSDECPDDANKTAVGECGCGVAETDNDSDGTPNCNDECPDDANKTEPGVCGCGIQDLDDDNDGTPNCEDECPIDANKTAPEACGCGVQDVDSDGDSVMDCNEPNGHCSTTGTICVEDGDCAGNEPITGFCISRGPTTSNSCVYDARFDTGQTNTCEGRTYNRCESGFDCPTGMSCGSFTATWCDVDAEGMCSYGVGGSTPGPANCSDDSDCTITDRLDVCVICGNGRIDAPPGACGDRCVQEQCDDGNQEDGDGCSSTCQMEGVCMDANGYSTYTKCATVSDCDDYYVCDSNYDGPCTCEIE